MTRRNIFGYIVLILIITLMQLPMVAASCFSTQKVDASSSEYTITNWAKKNATKTYFSAEEGCTYVVTLMESLFYPIEKIFYSAYQVSINTEDISYDDDNNILNPFVVDKDDNPLDRIEIPQESIVRDQNFNSQNLRQIRFEVTAHEWSAYQFIVQWNNGDESIEEESVFLYCTNIDNSAPHIALVDNTPIYQDGGYLFDFFVRANKFNSDRSANSGLSKVTVYRDINGTKETIKTHTSFTNSLIFYGDVLAIKGEYFVEAIDGVGNKTTVRVIKIDYDLADIPIIFDAERVLENKGNYKKELVDNLEYYYIKWQLLNYDENVTEAQLKAARDLASEALIQCITAERVFKVRVINNFYFDEVTVEGFDEKAYAHSVLGEVITMNISFAEYNLNNKDFSQMLLAGDMSKADRIFALNLELASDIKELTLSDFSSPIKITIPLSKYKNISAVAEDVVNGKTVYNKLRIDKGEGWITLHVPSANTTLNLIVNQSGAADSLKFLYLLFLLIPITGGILLLVFRDKIFKKKKPAINAPINEQEKAADRETENVNKTNAKNRVSEPVATSAIKSHPKAKPKNKKK